MNRAVATEKANREATALDEGHVPVAEKECLIIFRRRVVAQEVGAIALALAAAGVRARLLCPDAKLLEALPSAVREACAFSLLAAPGDGNQLQASSPQQATLRRWLRPRLAASVFGGIRLALALVRDRRLARAWLRRRETIALIVFEDRAPVPEMAFLHEARRIGVPSLLVPYAASSPQADAWFRRERAGHDLDRGGLSFVRRLAARKWPAHARDTEYGRLLFFRVPDILALALHGMAGTTVWTWGGGEADRVLVFGAADADNLATMLPPQRIVVAGQPSLDSLYRARSDRLQGKKRLSEKYGLAGGRPLLVVASPNWGEHGLSSWEEHWRLIKLLYSGLAASGADVLISLHPKSIRADYEIVAREFGLRIMDERLTDALPAADMFVAGWSSTLRWAAMLGIPSVNLALIGGNAVDYSQLSAMLTVTRGADVADTLRDLTQDEARRRTLGKALQAQAARIEVFDGNASQRVVETIFALRNSSSGACPNLRSPVLITKDVNA